MNLDGLTQDEVSGLFRSRRGNDPRKTGLGICRKAFVRGTKGDYSIGLGRCLRLGEGGEA